jgi:predicted GH43/DUF377 family glycosyl hydrolase
MAIVTAMVIITLNALFSVGALGASTVVWTSQSDFEAGQRLDVDVASSPGQLRLASTVSPWVKLASNPILGPAVGWEADWVDSPSVLYEAGVYKMWYQGCVGQLCGIGYATSADGIAWTRFAGNPVLTPNATSWDQTLGVPTVIHDGNAYRMWYTGNGPSAIRIGYATSTDGMNWTKYGDAPAFWGNFGWDSGAVSTPFVLKVDGTFVLYFSGQPGNYAYGIGRATSVDGFNWTEDPANPLMLPSDAWEESRIHPASILVGPSGYDLYYTGGYYQPQIGHATSVDGRTWTRDPGNPTIPVGTGSSWDRVGTAAARVLVVGNLTRMFYGGEAFWDGWRIGMADFAPGSGPRVYRPQGFFLSTVFDSGSPATKWNSLDWSGTISSGASVEVNIRVGSTAFPDASWSSLPWPIQSPGSYPLTFPRARYVQVGALLRSTNPSETPVLDAISVSYSPPEPPSVWESLVAGIPLFLLLLVLVPAAIVTAGGTLLWRWSRSDLGVASANVACGACGAPIPSTGRFCPRCGEPVTRPASN